MAFVPKAVHQFHGGSAAGDAITSGLLYTRRLLQELGYASEIYCQDVAPELFGKIWPAPMFPDSDDTLLLVHFSWAIRYFDWLTTLSCRKALIFHNITPPEYFEEGEEFERTSVISHQQLAALRPLVSAALTTSHYSARALHACGFDRPEVLPMLFDPEDWRLAPHDESVARALADDSSFNILFVGRVVANKRQEQLLHVVRHLKDAAKRRPHLILAGGIGAGPAYGKALAVLAKDLDVSDCVRFAGKVSNQELRALYRGADVFLSLSEHEGFCVPLIEAMASDLPVVALASSAVPETVGQGGLLLDEGHPAIVAGVLEVLADEPELRRRLVLAGRRNVRRFSRESTLHALATFMRNRLEVAVGVPPPPSSVDSPTIWRIDGPFDSSYSLASVNRSLGRALAKQGVAVGLYSTEGLGDFPPDPQYLQATPDVDRLWNDGRDMLRPTIVLRNLYPPRVTGMPGATRVLASWAWEETGLPSDWVSRFNNELNLITTVSRYVAKVLVDNGVKVPIVVVGNGAEHHGHGSQEFRHAEPGGRSFKFLHVSSGFPRKGVDVLLNAWGQSFKSTEPVTLVIKTFPNSHNEVKSGLDRLRMQHPDHAPVELIDRDLSEGAMADLYRTCDVLVAPSRGEGFGLPLVEAMLTDMPVVTTAHGGALDFCSDETAWLVDFEYRYSRSHFGLFNSVWAEPIPEDLGRTMRIVRDCTFADRKAKTSRAKALVQKVFSWPAVARRTKSAIASLDKLPVPSLTPKVALISTWNTRCGIASYARHQVSAFPCGAVQVFACYSDERLQPDEAFVRRCWQQGWDDDLEDLYQAVHRCGANITIIQFNFGFFSIEAFGRLLDRLSADAISCYVVLHSTIDVNKVERSISLRQIGDSLYRATRLLVHSAADLNRLKRLGLDAKATIVPHGVVRPGVDDDAKRRLALGFRKKRVIGCFGYMLPDKGFSVLIEAFLRLHQRHPDLHLLLVTSLYPAPASQQELNKCRQLLAGQSAGSAITFVTDYLSEQQAHQFLKAMDLLVFPYQQTQESSSGAVRFGLAAQKPVACSPLPIFDDVASIVHRLPGCTSADLERGIEALLANPGHLDCHAARQALWLQEHDWQAASAKFWNMLRAPQIIDLVAMDSGVAP